jgi:hypothetical protein
MQENIKLKQTDTRKTTHRNETTEKSTTMHEIKGNEISGSSNLPSEFIVVEITHVVEVVFLGSIQ